MVERLVPLFREAGVRLMLSGHEHNFQHSIVDGIHYVISGAAGKLRPEPPTDFEAAGTQSWASAGHFLIVEADEDRIRVHPVGDVSENGSLEAIELRGPEGGVVEAPLVVR